MSHRGDVCDKWHRYCGNCGNKAHINQVRGQTCDECGAEMWTREKPHARAN